MSPGWQYGPGRSKPRFSVLKLRPLFGFRFNRKNRLNLNVIFFRGKNLFSTEEYIPNYSTHCESGDGPTPDSADRTDGPQFTLHTQFTVFTDLSFHSFDSLPCLWLLMPAPVWTLFDKHPTEKDHIVCWRC